jgi:hypothetical protein
MRRKDVFRNRNVYMTKNGLEVSSDNKAANFCAGRPGSESHCQFSQSGAFFVVFTIRVQRTSVNLQEPCVLYIGRAYRYPQDVAFYIFYSTAISTGYFKHAAHSLFFSSKCPLFHNAAFSGSVLFTFYIQGVLKFKCKTPVPKG